MQVYKAYFAARTKKKLQQKLLKIAKNIYEK